MHHFSPEELIEQVSPVDSFYLSPFWQRVDSFKNQINADREMLGSFLKHCGKAGCIDAQD